MAAVLTTSMTLRIILSVRGTLVAGGSFALSGTTANSSTSRTTHVISTRSAGVPTNLSNQAPHTYTLDDMRTKPESEWVDENKSHNGDDGKPGVLDQGSGIKVTIDREVGYDTRGK